jgi:hypothetical protein
MGPEAYRLPDAFDAAFRRAMALCAGVLVVGAAVAWATVRRPAPDCRHPECHTHGSVAVPPLEPETERGEEHGTAAPRPRGTEPR